MLTCCVDYLAHCCSTSCGLLGLYLTLFGMSLVLQVSFLFVSLYCDWLCCKLIVDNCVTTRNLAIEDRLRVSCSSQVVQEFSF